MLALPVVRPALSRNVVRLPVVLTDYTQFFLISSGRLKPAKISHGTP
jgi:hypothetical protein